MVEYKISYELIEFFTGALINRLKHKNLKFDYVIGFGRGGLIPATMIAYKLSLPVLNYGVSSYINKDKTSAYNEYQSINFKNLPTTTRLLVVDDICDTGETFRYFKQIVDKNNISDITYTALFAKESSSTNVDFYSSLAGEDQWIVFLWDN